MKTILVSLAALMISAQAHALDIRCLTHDAEGVQVDLTATWEPGASLKDVVMNIDGFTSQYKKGILVEYNPRAKSYQGMNRFFISYAGWSETSLLLPKVLPASKAFRAYYYDHGHSGTGTAGLTCHIL